MKKKNAIRSFLYTAGVSLLSLLWWIPIIWMIGLAFKTNATDSSDLIAVLSPPYTLKNFDYVFNNGQADIMLWLLNSLFVAVVSTGLMLLLICFAAFAFARIPFKGKGFWFWLVMASMMIPGEATLIPLYLLFRDLGLLNSYSSLILPSLASAFSLLLLKQFFESLPKEIFEAARIDGCGWTRMLLKIAMPLSKTSLSAIGIFAFLGAWNNFLWPYISITDPKIMTVSVGLPFFRSQFNSDMGYPMAANTIASIPILIAFFILQKYIIKGIAFTGLKG